MLTFAWPAILLASMALPPTSCRHVMLARRKECSPKPEKSHSASTAAILSAFRTPESHMGLVRSSSCAKTQSSGLVMPCLAIQALKRSVSVPNASVLLLFFVFGSSTSPRQWRCWILIVPALRSRCFNCKPTASEMRVPVEMQVSHISSCGSTCLLYTSDAADERSSVDLGG